MLRKKMTLFSDKFLGKKKKYYICIRLHVVHTTCVPVTLIKHFSECGWSAKIGHVFCGKTIRAGLYKPALLCCKL